MKGLLTGVAAGAVITVLSLWLIGAAVRGALPSLHTLVALSPIVLALSAFFLSILGILVLALRMRPAGWSFPRTFFVAAGYAWAPFVATWLLFRESGESLLWLGSSWNAILECLPWVVAYLLGAMALLFALRRAPEDAVAEGAAGEPGA